jgi:2-oxoglutarate ferredoxin oxidoreductase subunit gamma
MEHEIRFSGFGGQGIILMGIVLGRAVALYDRPPGKEEGARRQAIQTQSYGPSARGGHTKCDVKIFEGEMLYPFVEVPDFLVIMSQQAYSKYITEAKPETRIIIDPDMVLDRPQGDVLMVPATKAAEGMDARVVANVIMLGAFREISDVVPYEALEKAMLEAVPKATHDLNRAALDLGRKLGREALASKGKG